MSDWIVTDGDASELGGKAAALARLAKAGLPIPAWFAVSPRAFKRSGVDGSVGLAGLRVAPDVADAIRAAIAALPHFGPGDGPFAVRSSAVDEDGGDHSFAGQLESFLFVPADRVVDRVADVWRSGYTPRVRAYRQERGLGEPVAPAVLVQRMIDADVSGVAFAADPIGGSRSTVVVSAVFGLGTALVGGDADADSFRLRHDGTLIESNIARKTLRHVADINGIRELQVDDAEADRPSLTVAQARAVADLALATSAAEGRPQDIEWAMRHGKVWLLQSRPITSMDQVADPEGGRAIWDNSNIAESYNGITTPLTFSFARRAYEGAYRGFCQLMKVPTSVVRDNDAMFGQMLGLIRGRVYYNLLNWYRLIAMMPGYAVNRGFMEGMMGVREGLPDEIANDVKDRTWTQRFGDRARLAWSGGGLIYNHFALPRKIAAFYKRLDAALAPPAKPLASMRIDELAAYFCRLERDLLTRWDAPLINDFLAMMFFGALGKATARLLPGEPNLHNDLLGDEGGIISIEPVHRIAEMAALVAPYATLVDALCESEDVAEIERRIASFPALHAKYRSYLDKFGDRCLEELKLESSTLTDDPTPLLRTIGQAARRTATPAQPYRPRKEAEAKVAAALEGRPYRARLFAWLLRSARARVRDRENLRFERTRLFGRVRRIVVEMGRRLASEGLLDEPRDVFYLTLDELLAFCEGTSVDDQLRDVARRRRERFAEYATLPQPADRFETRGPPYLGNRFEASRVETPAASGDLRGVGCCPGVVRARCRVIRDPRGASIAQGEILVAERTDPGWIMLFPAAAGVLVERGSLLSHSAIVARELGIPAVVSIPNLLATLKDGDVVEMDGSTGAVRIVERHE